jgi:hypothetical protein
MCIFCFVCVLIGKIQMQIQIQIQIWKSIFIWKIINGGKQLITAASVNSLMEAGGLRHPPRLIG